MSDPRVLIVSALRNEGPYLVDWLAHLIGAGAQDFRLYSNACDDGTDEMLDLLAAAGVITHCRHAPAPDVSVQWQAFRDAWKSDARKRADWALICDVDEYPNIQVGAHRFADLIAALPAGCDAVTLPWRLFGSGGQIWAEDRPVTERFTRAARDGAAYPLAVRRFKTLMRCAGPFNQFGIHRPSQKAPDKAPPPVWADGAGRVLPQGFASRAGQIALPEGAGQSELVQLNHYSLRSAQEFVIKRHRGLPNRRHRAIDLTYWAERNFNTVEERSIAAMAGATRAAKDRLFQIDGLRAAHERACAWHLGAFEHLMRDEAHYALFTHAILAGDSREIDQPTAQTLYRMYQAVQSR